MTAARVAGKRHQRHKRETGWWKTHSEKLLYTTHTTRWGTSEAFLSPTMAEAEAIKALLEGYEIRAAGWKC